MFLPVTTSVSLTVASAQESSTVGSISVWASVAPQNPPDVLPSRSANGGAAGSKHTLVNAPSIIGPVLPIPSKDAIAPHILFPQCDHVRPVSRGALAGIIVGSLSPLLIFALLTCLSVHIIKKRRKRQARGETTHLSGNGAEPTAVGLSLVNSRSPTTVQRPRLRPPSAPKNAILTGPAKPLLPTGALGIGASTPAALRSRSRIEPTTPQPIDPDTEETDRAAGGRKEAKYAMTMT